MRGDCFVVAVQVAERLAGTGVEVAIVHGRPVYRGDETPDADGRFWHAWVETAQVVRFPDSEFEATVVSCVDESNGGEVRLPQAVFYRVGDLDESVVRRYTLDEAMRKMVEVKTFGPWPESF